MTASPLTFTLNLTCERRQIRNAVRAVVHATLFQRVLGNVTPREIDVLGLTFAAIHDIDTSALVESRVEHLARALESPTSKSRGQITVSFLEKRTAKKSSWWAPNEKEKAWEEWIISVNVESASTERERAFVDAETRRQLVQFQTRSLAFVNDQRAHIPPITSSESFPFPIEIVVGQR